MRAEGKGYKEIAEALGISSAKSARRLVSEYKTSRPIILPPPCTADIGLDCENCGGQKCMGCVCREWDHQCKQDCPMCCEPALPPHACTHRHLALNMLGAGGYTSTYWTCTACNARVDPPSAPAIAAVPNKPTSHLVIPDTQCKPGVPLDHLYWAGRYIAERQPDVVVHLGDHWDFPSLSSYEKPGSRYFEGKRILADIEAGNEGLRLLEQGMGSFQPKRKVLLRGNHEGRLTRALNEEPKLEGLVGFDNFIDRELGWEVVDFLKPIEIDGVHYCHYFYNPSTGRPYSGNPETMLKNIGFSFTMGHQQGLRVARRELSNGQAQRALIAGCLTPEHRVLTADLRYVPIGELVAGDQLVSFDEHISDSPGRARRFRTGTLLATERAVRDVFKVTLASGKSFTTTEDHGWLTKITQSWYRWKMTKELVPGKTRIPKLVAEWDALESFDAGWLSGMYDGEGHLYCRRTTGGYVMQLAITQKQGPTLERIQRLLQNVCGEESAAGHVHNDVMSIILRGGTYNIAKVLGQLRPSRLLPKFYPELLGSVRCPKDNKRLDLVVSVEPAGRAEIVQTKVDCGTLIVEGYPHHNSFYQHEEDYLGAQGNRHWRGLLVKHEVRDGDYDLMEVSLDYIKRKFS